MFVINEMKISISWTACKASEERVNHMCNFNMDSLNLDMPMLEGMTDLRPDNLKEKYDLLKTNQVG